MESGIAQVLEKEEALANAAGYINSFICVGFPMYFSLPCKLEVPWG